MINTPQNYPSDYHIHTPYCGHAKGKIIEYVEYAIRKGMSEICFTDHLGRYYLSKSQKRRYWDWGMDEHKLARYISEIETISEAFSDQIIVRIGLEIDYVEGAEELLEPFLKNYEFDYLIGSIHCLQAFGWKHIANYSRDDFWPVYQEYFRTAESMLSSGIFDTLAHLDFIWRYTKWPNKKTHEIFYEIDNTISKASKYNHGIELNGNGYLWSELYTVRGGDPFDIMLSAISKYKCTTTLGSDAHQPKYVGKSFKEISNLMEEKKINTYTIYKKRKPIIKNLPSST